MSFEEAMVVCVVYLSVIIPILLFLKNKSFLPRWVFPIYVISFLACAIGWELWFTYGWVDGAAVNLRRSDALNNWLPKDINWLMNSLGDAGAVLLGGFWIMWMSAYKDQRIFLKWNWKWENGLVSPNFGFVYSRDITLGEKLIKIAVDNDIEGCVEEHATFLYADCTLDEYIKNYQPLVTYGVSNKALTNGSKVSKLQKRFNDYMDTQLKMNIYCEHI
jgi:hypothetical protein